MATTSRNTCDVCGKTKGITKCEGCEKIFCYNHFGVHRQELNQQLDEIEANRDLFRKTLNEQTTDSQKHPILQQIDDWEFYSVRKVRKAAGEAREMVFEYMKKIEVKLKKLSKQLSQSREENDFVETDLYEWKEKLTYLTDQFSKPSTITLQQDSQPLVTKISVDITSSQCICSLFL